jgi:hypothetical protein
MQNGMKPFKSGEMQTVMNVLAKYEEAVVDIGPAFQCCLCVKVHTPRGQKTVLGNGTASRGTASFYNIYKMRDSISRRSNLNIISGDDDTL